MTLRWASAPSIPSGGDRVVELSQEAVVRARATTSSSSETRRVVQASGA